MTVHELIKALKTVHNQEAQVMVCTQLATETVDCIVYKVDDSRAEFGEDSDGAIWLKWPGAEWETP